jgi:hypothetical protein
LFFVSKIICGKYFEDNYEKLRGKSDLNKIAIKFLI